MIYRCLQITQATSWLVRKLGSIVLVKCLQSQSRGTEMSSRRSNSRYSATSSSSMGSVSKIYSSTLVLHFSVWFNFSFLFSFPNFAVGIGLTPEAAKGDNSTWDTNKTRSATVKYGRYTGKTMFGDSIGIFCTLEQCTEFICYKFNRIIFALNFPVLLLFFPALLSKKDLFRKIMYRCTQCC